MALLKIRITIDFNLKSTKNASRHHSHDHLWVLWTKNIKIDADDAAEVLCQGDQISVQKDCEK